jgi:hypothetical protein
MQVLLFLSGLIQAFRQSWAHKINIIMHYMFIMKYYNNDKKLLHPCSGMRLAKA